MWNQQRCITMTLMKGIKLMSAVTNSYTILYFLDYGKEFGGAANTLIQQAILAKKAGCNAIIFFSDYYGTKMNDEYKTICEGLEIEYEWEIYQISSQTEDIDVVCLDENYEKLRDKITSYQPDILHSVQINPCVELISRECQIPHIMNIYPLIPAFFSVQYMNIFPHYHICDSWFYAQKWQQYLHTDSTCIRTVVNATASREKKFSKRMIRFICAGSIYKDKNQLTVIKAFHRAVQHGVRGKLTLCGYAQGDYGRECVKYIEKYGLQKYIIIKGFCSDMNYEYSQQDILICGSKRESYPNVISEAMANGLIVISTPVAGVPEIIVDEVNGYLARDYSEDALYEKIVQVQNDVENGMIDRILSNEKETFLQNHSPRAVTKQLIQYYEHVIEDYNVRNEVESERELFGIDEIRSSFKDFLGKFYQNRRNFSEPNKVALKLWYLYHIQEIIKRAHAKECKFYIWGTGKYGIAVKDIVETFMPEVPIKGFLDSHRTGDFQGYHIYQPDEILQKENIIVFIAAVNGQNEMIEQLEKNRFFFNRDYFILAARRW